MRESGESLRARIERVLSGGGPAVYRLGAAGTSITFMLSENGEDPVTLLLDREPPELADDVDAEITVEMGPAAAEQFTRGKLVLAISLMEGDSTSRGPIRKYLAVDPILRGLLARADASDRPVEAGD